MRTGSKTRLIVWPPLPPDVYLRRPQPHLPWPLEERKCLLFARARHALYAGVRTLGLSRDDGVLVPAYHHGSEVEALMQAGLRVHFYDASDGLEPDAKTLDAQLDSSIRALYLTHYLGLPADSARWRRWCDERGLLLIEDAAQAWLARTETGPVGSTADCAIYCLYKTFGLADGAALWSETPPPGPARRGPPGIAHLALRHGSYLAQRWSWLAGLRAGIEDNSFDMSAEVALGDVGRGTYRSTPRMLTRVADPGARHCRLHNYRFLTEQLHGLLPEAFPDAGDGASPFAFPIAVAHKDDVRAHLLQRGIVALDFWSQPHPSLDPASAPRAAALRASILALPVHQELRRHDLEHIVDAVREAARAAP
jgi:perosamine synthetase